MTERPKRLDHAAATLLSDLKVWRLRAIEHVELSRALWSERERIIHVHSFQEVMKRSTPEAERFRDALYPLGGEPENDIELVLPITELPKVPVLDLKITVDGKPVYRLSKDEAARIQANYLLALARDAGLLEEHGQAPEFFTDFLTFIFHFPPYSYEKQWKHLRTQRPFRDRKSVV